MRVTGARTLRVFIKYPADGNIKLLERFADRRTVNAQNSYAC
jgi:hypothetical protein